MEGCVHYRTLGRTGIEVSEIGYGAWGIAGDAWLGAKDEESLKALNRAVDLGLNFIDTALAYGEGHSERLVGKIVKERLSNLGLETIDVQQFHVWQDDWTGEGDWQEAVDELKGRARSAFSASPSTTTSRPMP
jgi:aryl-alcohol dehydrogenase-like predicted oxidoreductase